MTAAGAGTPAATTPGRAAYETYLRAVADPLLPPWDELTTREQRAFAAVEQDARDSLTGRVAELVSESNQLRASLAALTDRAEAGGILTEDEADEYRKLSGSPDGGGGRDAGA